MNDAPGSLFLSMSHLLLRDGAGVCIFFLHFFYNFWIGGASLGELAADGSKVVGGGVCCGVGSHGVGTGLGVSIRTS